MKINLPDLSLVVLVGTTGSGKSTFARTHFKPTEIMSSDYFRGLVSDDENDQSATGDAFETLHFVAGKRLAAGRLTVIDATNVQQDARKPLVALARRLHVLPVAIVLDIPERICEDRNRERPDRQFGPHVLRRQRLDLKRSIKGLGREGFRHVWVLEPEDVDGVEIERQPLWNNKKDLHGPFDIIGDVHGCGDELEDLLAALGYEVRERREGTALDAGPVYRHPAGRQAVFVGDLVDRGPRVLDTLRIVRNMVDAGSGLTVMGNHERKLLRALQGRNVQITHGLGESLADIEAVPADDRPALVEALKTWLDGLISHYVLDDGKLVVAHAGLKAEMQGRGSGAVREFALFGDTTGEIDEFGLPVRLNWAADYRGKAMVVYGHTPVPEAEWLNNTTDVDTGCVFGGKLTALRYPERVFVSVSARQTYYEPARPFLPPDDHAPRLTAQQVQDDTLDLGDVIGKRLVETRLAGKVTIREENAAAAIEVMSRFAVDPRWLIYLPPTMSPSETSHEPGLLEHPAEAFAYFRTNGIPRVVVEEKHMGSRAVLVVCRDADAARKRFGVTDGSAGSIFTRTGRPFFEEPLATEVLDRVRLAIDGAGTWEDLATDWVLLDAELMPWSAKAQELIRTQYAPTGVAAQTALAAVLGALDEAAVDGVDTGAIAERMRLRQGLADRYVEAYARYSWPVGSIADLRLAPFHLLASEGRTHTDRDHVWHMERLAVICHQDEGLMLTTRYRVVDVTDSAQEASAVEWWQDLTGRGGEGMVVKPLDFIPPRGQKRPIQPAVKCRGPEYLRIIYGPEYDLPEHLERLRERGLAGKRGLAHREFALGIEAMERFARREPLRRIHECVFGVLALESEPVDPRL
ncbi:MAG: prpE [Chloroflexota bacterium]|nr:prpE [Chloroflexota bacterium]